MKKWSIKSILALAPLIPFLISAALLFGIGRQIYQTDLQGFDKTLQREHRQTQAELERLVQDDIQTLQDSIVKLFTVTSVEQLNHLEQNQDKLSLQLSLQLLHKDFHSGIIENSELPVRFRVFRYKTKSFFRTVSHLNELFAPDFTSVGGISKSKDPIFSAISGLNIKVQADFATHFAGIDEKFFPMLNQLVESQDLLLPSTADPDFGLFDQKYFPLKQFIYAEGQGGINLNDKVFPGREDKFTDKYPIPRPWIDFDPSLEFPQEDISDPGLWPLIWIASYISCRSTRFGPALHPAHRLLESNVSDQPLRNRSSFIQAFSADLAWDVYPNNFFHWPEAGIVPLLPQRILVGAVYKQQLLPIITRQHANVLKTKELQITVLPSDYSVAQTFYTTNYDNRVWKCSHLASETLGMSQLRYCGPAQPSPFSENLSDTEAEFATRWRFILLAAILCLALSLWPLRRLGKRIEISLSYLMNRLLNSEVPAATSAMELAELNQGLETLIQGSEERVFDFALALRLLQILNQPGMTLDEYVEELQYGLRDAMQNPGLRIVTCGATTADLVVTSSCRTLGVQGSLQIGDSSHRILMEILDACLAKGNLENQAKDHHKLMHELKLSQAVCEALIPKKLAGECPSFSYEVIIQMNQADKILVCIDDSLEELRICAFHFSNMSLGDLLMLSALHARLNALLTINPALIADELLRPQPIAGFNLSLRSYDHTYIQKYQVDEEFTDGKLTSLSLSQNLVSVRIKYK